MNCGMWRTERIARRTCPHGVEIDICGGRQDCAIVEESL
jgi:hypothetical protein